MSEKKLLLIYPSVYDASGRLIKSRIAGIPSRTLPYLAGITPSRYDIRIVDEEVQDLAFDSDVDLVALTGMLPHIPRAIDIAREFHRRGIPTIIGGTGAYSVRDAIEASGVFTSVVLGEVEDIWEQILDDFERKDLKPCYECTSPPSLDNLRRARFDLLDLSKYVKSFVDRTMPMLPVETSRGCPNNCSYCLVTRFFGRHMRYRPVGDVVDELKNLGARHVLFTDDNIAINPRRSRELFEAIKPLGIRWFGQFETRVVRDPELLRLAAESGCTTAFVGIESLDPTNLRAVNKSQNAKVELQEIVEGFHQAGIVLLASLIFGLDNDTPSVVDWTIRQMIDSGVDTVYPWILTPIPGTPVHDQVKKEGRLLHENYSLYNGINAIVRPKRMTPEELEHAYWKGLRQFYGYSALIPRVLRAKRNKVGELLYNLHVHRQVGRGLHPFSGIPA